MHINCNMRIYLLASNIIIILEYIIIIDKHILLQNSALYVKYIGYISTCIMINRYVANANGRGLTTHACTCTIIVARCLRWSLSMLFIISLSWFCVLLWFASIELPHNIYIYIYVYKTHASQLLLLSLSLSI